MSDTSVKVGMLGAGFILKSHATAVKAIPEAKLHMIADAAPGRAKRAAEIYGFAHVAGSIEEIAASDCDVVHILLPPAYHISAARAMIQTGKHVFLEKPMGIDSQSCALLCEEAASRGLTVGVNHNFLFGHRYEQLRAAIKSGEIGRVDAVSVDWLYDLPQLRFGPFDNWMLAAAANTLFETAPHLIAFILDLAGKPNIAMAQASNPVQLPSGVIVPRHWRASGVAGSATIAASLSQTPGEASRLLHVRGRGGSIAYDFGRDIGTLTKTATSNPMLDVWQTALVSGSSQRRQGWSSLARQLGSALTKKPDSSPFEASVFRSIRSFYENDVTNVDPRHAGGFAVDVMRVCEQIAQAGGVGPTVAHAPQPALPRPLRAPDVLVVGGTGFIGRALVEKLVKRGRSVRVLSRNLNAAAFQFSGMPVEIMGGSHGDAETVKRALTGVDTVYHLAKCDGQRWQDYLDGDIAPTHILGEAALAAKVSRFIYTGTIDSYASADPRKVINSTTPVDPAIGKRNLYARSKATCEGLLRDLGLPLVIMRPAIVIGPGSPPAHLGIGRFAGETRVEYWGDGHNMLPLVSVDDVAEALALGAKVAGIEGKQFMLASPPLMSARDYVAAYEQLAEVEVEQIARSPLRYWLADLAKEALKGAIRHPNRRASTWHDWACKSHKARYDARDAEQILGWHPVASKQQMIDSVIAPMIAHWLN